MLKKKENSLYRVRGKKLQGVYFAFDTTFAGYLVRCVWPTRTSRGGFVSVCSESDLVVRLEEPKRKLAALIPGILNREPLCDTRSRSTNERAELRRRSLRRGASSSVKLRELACDLRSPSSSPSSSRPAVSSDAPCAPEAFRRHTRFPMPTRKFRKAMPGPRLRWRFDSSRERRGDPYKWVLLGSSSSKSRSSSEPESPAILARPCGWR